MKFLYFLTLGFILILTNSPAFAERDFTAVQLKTTHVRGNIYMLEGVNGFAGGNIGVSVGEDGILIVDDQFAEMSDKIKAALTSLNPGKPRFILNTHWHGDHTGSNAIFSNEAIIIAHDNVRKRLMTEQKKAWPVITFDQSLTVHFNNEAIKLLHFPNGHTDGDSVIYFPKSNVVHMGDYFFAGMFPFVDLKSGGNVINFTENIGQILETIPQDAMIIPGHGPLSTRDDLINYHQMLKNSIAFVQQHIKDGTNLENIQKQGLPAELKIWANGLLKEDAWIQIIYQSIMEQ